MRAQGLRVGSSEAPWTPDPTQWGAVHTGASQPAPSEWGQGFKMRREDSVCQGPPLCHARDFQQPPTPPSGGLCFPLYNGVVPGRSTPPGRVLSGPCWPSAPHLVFAPHTCLGLLLGVTGETVSMGTAGGFPPPCSHSPHHTFAPWDAGVGLKCLSGKGARSSWRHAEGRGQRRLARARWEEGRTGTAGKGQRWDLAWAVCGWFRFWREARVVWDREDGGVQATQGLGAPVTPEGRDGGGETWDPCLDCT